MGRPKRTTKQRKNPKLDKLEAFLEDFDSEVKTVVERLKERTNSLLKDADNFYNMAVIKLPKAVRQMNWLEHCGSEKPKSPVSPVEDAKKVEEAAQVESIMAEVHTIPPKTAKKAMSKRGGARTSSEDEENNITATGKKGKSTRKPPTSKRAKALSVSKQNTSIRNSSRKPLVTPSRNMLDSSLMGPTPLITPRFDSRLPKTPAVRIPRHKERVYSISVNGSPISGCSNDIAINVPVGNGECIQLLASQMDTVDLGQLDETAIRSIRLLQNRLTTLCESSE
ncbi:borealin [Coregonus clupeaformis]|uniref:borealin n=1 Tax=Coregonus clupeaformis TaxID=59861 RepID=UPI001BE048F8|nr:borealin [Coregonus clupeaformis]